MLRVKDEIMDRIGEIWERMFAYLEGKKKRGLNIKCFLKFYNITRKQANEMTFVEMEKLPKVLELNIKSYGGRPHFDEVAWRWKVGRNNHPNLNSNDDITCHDKDYNSAALKGLVLCFELIYYRRTQGNITLG